MANDFEGLKWEVWSSEIQENLYPMLTSQEIVNKMEMSGADTYHMPYIQKPVLQTYTPGTDLNIPDQDAVDEKLELTTVESSAVYVDKIDEVESNYSIRNEYSQEIAQSLAARLDAVVFATYGQFANTVDAGDVGGTSGSPIVVDPSKARSLLAKCKTKLTNKNVPASNRVAVLNPSLCEELTLSIAAQDVPGLSKEAFERGYVGRYFGFDVFESANLTFTARWTPIDNPTTTDTITINGVVITFIAALSGADGEVLIGANTAATLDNLVALLNDPTNSASSSNYSAFSADDTATLTGMTATDGATYVGIVYVGGGEVNLLSDEAADLWSLQTVHSVAGYRGKISMAIAPLPGVGFNQEPKRPTGSGNLIGTIDYGLKVFNRHADYLVDISIDGSAF